MKNLMSTGFFAVVLSVSLFSCNNPSEPQPEASQQIEAKQNPTKTNSNQAKLMSRFQWKLAKTGTFGNGERVSLKTPVGMGYMVGGDLTYKVSGTDGALVPFTVQFLNLGNTDKGLVDPASLNSKRFNTNTIWAADGNGADQPNELYTNTTIAIKDANGKYFILEVVKFLGFELKVNIYEESYFTGNARLPYELPD